MKHIEIGEKYVVICEKTADICVSCLSAYSFFYVVKYQ